MKIYIEISNRKFITIEVNPSEPIKKIKQLIEEKGIYFKDNLKLVLIENIRIDAKTKIYQLYETVLDDKIIISKYNIKDKTILTIF